MGLSRQHTAEDRARPPITTTTQQDATHPRQETEEEKERAMGAPMSDLQISKTATQTHANGIPHGNTVGGGDAGGGGADLQNEKTITNGGAGGTALFTADDLAKAMSQSTIKQGGMVR